MYSVTKEFKFDSAHRLVQGYKGKCSNLHGHTWKVRVTVQSEELNQYGFVWDFGDFKPLRKWIDDALDHATIVSQSDEDTIHFLRTKGHKFHVTAANPTSEHLAQLIYDMAWQFDIPAVVVEVDETCTCSARYEP